MLLGRVLPILPILLILATLLGCNAAGQRGLAPDDSALTADPTVLGEIISPLAATKSAQAIVNADPDGMRFFATAGEYEHYPSANVSTGFQGLDFSPSWQPGAASIAGAAYAMYQLNAWDGAQFDVRLQWVFAPPEGSYWVGLAHWQHDRWAWFEGTADGVIAPPLFERYMDAEGDVLVCVLCLGTAPSSLQALSIGPRPAALQVVATPTSGHAPLAVTVTVGVTVESSAFVQAELDADGDGSFEQQSALGEFQHTYTAPGLYRAVVRATLTEGRIMYAERKIWVFYETEDNDGHTGSNSAAHFMCGHIGNAGIAGQYDGDTLDVFSASTLSPTIMQLHHNAALEPPIVEIYDGMFELKSASAPADENLAQITWPGILFIDYFHVKQGFGGSEYCLVIGDGAVPTLNCNYGPASGLAPLEVSFDASASSDDNGIARYEWDLDGDGIYEQNTGTVPTISQTYETRGLVLAQLRIHDVTGLMVRRVMPVMLGPFEELEHNDHFGEANELGRSALNFAGHCGIGGLAGDGDQQDYYKLDMGGNNIVDVDLRFNEAGSSLILSVYDAQFDLLAQSSAGFGRERIVYTLAPVDEVPLYILVEDAGGGESPYLLNCVSRDSH